MQLLFLDESGDHNLTAINPDYPVFVLGGVLVDGDYANRALEDEVAQFKVDMFGRADIGLHTMDIVRQRNGFEALKDADFRKRFRGSLNTLMSRLEYRVIACAIRKPDLLKRHGATVRDPYSHCSNSRSESASAWTQAASPPGRVTVARSLAEEAGSER